MNKQGEKNGYDSWQMCQSCSHEHWCGYIVSAVGPDGLIYRFSCISCVIGHPCIFEPVRTLDVS